MANQFDISEGKRRILEENAKRKLELRNEFLKETSNPFRHASGEGGHVFDAAMQRYNSMRVSSYEFFRPSPKNAFFALSMTIIPIVGVTYYFHKCKVEKEAKYRTGQVAYKDRNFKFI